MHDHSVLNPEAIANKLLEVNLSYRTGTVNLLGQFQVFDKGDHLFGHADELMPFCTAHGCTQTFKIGFSPTQRHLDAIGKLPDPTNKATWPQWVKDEVTNWYEQKIVCPTCGHVQIRSDLAAAYGFNMPVVRIADKIARFFTELGGCDVYLVRAKNVGALKDVKNELRSTSMDKKRYDRMFEQARSREQAFYSLKKIMKDAERSSLPKLFEAFLRS